MDIQAAAAAGGGIAGDDTAGHGQGGGLGVEVDGTAVSLGGPVAGDSAAVDVYGAAAVGIDRAAALSGIAGDGAAVDVHGAAGLIGAVQEDGTAAFVAVVIGDGAAIEIQHALAVVQGDGSAAAFVADLAAGDGAAEDIQRALIEVDAAAAPAPGGTLEGAGAGAVAENQTAAVFHLDLIGSVAGQSTAAQTQVEGGAVHHQVTGDGGVPGQVDIGGLIRVGDGVRAVPGGKEHGIVAGVIAHGGGAAADAVLMPEGPVGIEGVIVPGGDDGGLLHLGAAVLLGEPAVKAVVGAPGCGEGAVGIAAADGLALLSGGKGAAVGVKGDGGGGDGVAQPALVAEILAADGGGPDIQLSIVRILADEFSDAFRADCVHIHVGLYGGASVRNAHKPDTQLGSLGQVGAEGFEAIAADGKVHISVGHIDVGGDAGGGVAIDIGSAGEGVDPVIVAANPEAAALGSCVAGDGDILQLELLLPQIDAAALMGGVAGDGAADEGGTVGIVGIEAAAAAGGDIVLDFAAVQIQIVGLLLGEAAAVFGLVAGDGAAVHLDGAEALPGDVDAAAVAGSRIAFDLAGVQGDCGVGAGGEGHIMDNAHTAAVFS